LHKICITELLFNSGLVTTAESLG